MTRPLDPISESIILRKARELAAQTKRNPTRLAARALALYRAGNTMPVVMREIAA